MRCTSSYALRKRAPHSRVAELGALRERAPRSCVDEFCAINLSLTFSVMKTTVCASLVPVPVGGHLVGVRVWLNFVPSKCCHYVHVCLNLVPSKREHHARLWLVWVPSKFSVSYLASRFFSLWFLFLWGVASFACGWG